MSSNPTVVLIGAGHAHLHLAARAAQYAARGIRLLLVDPGHFWYSGMATGMLGGRYPSSADRLDPEALIRAGGGAFRRGRAVGVDAAERCVILADGETLPYDRLSLNVGSEVAADVTVAENDAEVWPVKPISQLWAMRRSLTERLRIAGTDCDLVVAGAGATGCEVAANLAALGRTLPGRLRVTLCASGPRLLPGAPAGAQRRLARHLTRLGVAVVTHSRVTSKSGPTVVLADGRRLRADGLVLAAGLRAAGLTRATGLPWDPRGGLRVDATLKSEADEAVFAAGDCAYFVPRPLPKLGVFGVRAAAVLHRNLMASLAGQRLTAYRPQRRYLSILNLGDGTGLATWDGLWWHGQGSMWVKDRIDRAFMDGYRALSGGRPPRREH